VKEERALKIGIMGAGAIGSYVGGRLAAEGVDVVFVSRHALSPAFDATGFSLVELGGERRALARSKIVHTTDVASLSDRDVVLCCVKSGATADVAGQLKAVLPRGVIAVSLQNGMHNGEVLRAGLPEQIVLAGIVGFNVVSREGGVFQRTTSGPLVIEAHPDERVAALGRTLERSGFEVKIAADVQALQWAKLVMNLNNAVSALSDVPTKDLLFSSGYRKVLAAIVAESVRVLRKAGIRTASLTGLPVSWMPLLLGLPTPILRVVASTQLKIDPDARSSMWEDLVKGRPTEVDQLNGEIVRLAESCGAHAPINRRVVEVVHRYEKEGRGSPGLAPEALWAELTAPG
jgi:2-dehydropantoate 2-reductase